MRALAILLLALLIVLLPPSGQALADHLSPIDCALPEFAGHPHCASTGTGDFPNDGRIGDWGGDYIVYCKNGFLEVWRIKQGTNQGELVAKFPLGDVRPGDSLHDPTSGVTVTRFADSVQVSGWNNGNNALGYNIRSIDARDCEGLKSAAQLRFDELLEMKSGLVDAVLQWVAAKYEGSWPPERLEEARLALLDQLARLQYDLGRFVAQNPDWPGAWDQLGAAVELRRGALALLAG